MKKSTERRIRSILNNYHPQVEEGEESMTFDEACRLVEGVMAHGESEEAAIDCLKYCTVGSDFKEPEQLAKEYDELKEDVKECKFYSRLVFSKIGHLGLLLLCMFSLENAKKKKKDTFFEEGMFISAAAFYIMDDIKELLHVMRAKHKKK